MILATDGLRLRAIDNDVSMSFNFLCDCKYNALTCHADLNGRLSVIICSLKSVLSGNPRE